MLLKRRAPGIEHLPAIATKGFEHLDGDSIAVLRWLVANGVDFVLVGALAQRIRGQRQARGPVAIVPAPYHRNYGRLARALSAAHARQRTEATAAGESDAVAVKVTAEKLARGERWSFRCGAHDIDIETVRTGARHDGKSASSYEELLYEATRLEPVAGVAVEVASPEDIERYAYGSSGSAGVAPAAASETQD